MMSLSVFVLGLNLLPKNLKEKSFSKVLRPLTKGMTIHPRKGNYF